MKKLIPLFSLLIILLGSCNSSFHNVRQHAHRNYIKIGPGIPDEQENRVELTGNKVRLINTKEQAKVPVTKTKIPPFKTNKPHQHLKENKKPGFIKTTFEKIKNLFPQKSKNLGKSVKNEKATKISAVFNIISFVLGLSGVILGFITGIVFLFTIAFPPTAVTGIAMAIVVCSIGVLAIIFGVLGLSLDTPKKGFAIAGIITAGVGILLAVLSLILFFAFL